MNSEDRNVVMTQDTKLVVMTLDIKAELNSLCRVLMRVPSGKKNYLTSVPNNTLSQTFASKIAPYLDWKQRLVLA